MASSYARQLTPEESRLLIGGLSWRYFKGGAAAGGHRIWDTRIVTVIGVSYRYESPNGISLKPKSAVADLSHPELFINVINPTIAVGVKTQLWCCFKCISCYGEKERTQLLWQQEFYHKCRVLFTSSSYMCCAYLSV